MLEGGLAQGALEQEGLVGELERVAVVEVDLHLRRPGLVGQRVDVDLLRLAPVVDVLEDRVELVDGVDAERLARGLLPARAADRRHQRVVRVLVDLGQEELELGCDHRLPALVGVEAEHPAQHVARGDLHRRAVMVVAVGQHLRGRLRVPGHEPDRVRVRPQADVAVDRVDHVLLGILAGDGLDEDALRQPQAVVVERADELLSRQDLAARDAVDVGDDALDLGDVVLAQPILEVRLSRLVRHETSLMPSLAVRACQHHVAGGNPSPSSSRDCRDASEHDFFSRGQLCEYCEA